MDEQYLKESTFVRGLRIVLKVLVYLVLVLLFFVIGLLIGYAIIGDGNYWEVLNQETWQHIVDFIK